MDNSDSRSSSEASSDTKIEVDSLSQISLSWRNIHYEVSTGSFFSKSKDTKVILNNVSGHAQTGELVALMGPSGKLLPLTAGSLFVKGLEKLLCLMYWLAEYKMESLATSWSTGQSLTDVNSSETQLTFNKTTQCMVN